MLFGVYEAKRKANRPSLVYCGDERSKGVVAELIRDVRFDPVDARPQKAVSLGGRVADSQKLESRRHPRRLSDGRVL